MKKNKLEKVDIWKYVPKNVSYKKYKKLSNLEKRAIDMKEEYNKIKAYEEIGKPIETLFGNITLKEPAETVMETTRNEIKIWIDYYINKTKKEVNFPYHLKNEVQWSIITCYMPEGIDKEINKQYDIIKNRYDEIKKLERIRNQLNYQKRIINLELVCQFFDYYVLKKIIPDGVEYINKQFKLMSIEIGSEIKKAKEIIKKSEEEIKKLKEVKIMTGERIKLFDMQFDNNTTDIDIKNQNKEIGFNDKQIIVNNQESNVEKKINKYISILSKYGYKILKYQLLKISGKGAKTISNFIPFITKKITYTNGNGSNFKYKIKAINLDTKEELQEIIISKEQYESFRFVIGSEWEGEAVVEGNNNILLRQVCEILSKYTMEKETIYTNTGFERIDNKLVYLYHNGCIGFNKNIKADLTADTLEQYCFTNKKFDEKVALNESLKMLNLADKKVAVPLLAVTYLSPLISILEDVGIFADFILYLLGPSGTRKSSISAVALSHFGNKFQRNNFPMNFRSTINNLEKKAFELKDTLVVLDDLNPQTASNDKAKVFEEAIGLYGDRVGRGRMKSNGQDLRKAYSARGTCIATGEFLPNISLSRLARLMIIHVNKESVNLEVLSELQANKDMLAFSMMKYIEYIIKNEEAIKIYAKDKLQKSQNNIHGRLCEVVNTLLIAYSIFVEFLQKNNIIVAEQKEALINEASNILWDIAEEKDKEIEEANPINMFYLALDELYITKKIYFKDYKTGIPVDGKGEGTFVGYIDNEKTRYYLLPDTVYREIYKFYISNGNKFPLTALSLWRYLQDAGLLKMTDKSRKTVLRTDVITGEKVRVLDIALKKDYI